MGNYIPDVLPPLEDEKLTAIYTLFMLILVCAVCTWVQERHGQMTNENALLSALLMSGPSQLEPTHSLPFCFSALCYALVLTRFATFIATQKS